MDVRGPVIDGVEQHFLYMNLTTGASSISCPAASSALAAVSSSKVGLMSSLVRFFRASDADSAYLLTRAPVLGCSTTIGSTGRPVWKRIRRGPCSGLGRHDGHRQPVAAFDERMTLCVAISLRSMGIRKM